MSVPLTGTVQLASQGVSDIQSNPYWDSIMGAINNGTASIVQTGSNPGYLGLPSTPIYGISIGGTILPASTATNIPIMGGMTPAAVSISPVTGTPGAYNISFGNPESEGNISGVVATDSSGAIQPINNLAQQFTYTPGSPGGFFQSGFGQFLEMAIPMALTAGGAAAGLLGSLSSGVESVTGLTAGSAANAAVTGAITGALKNAVTGGNILSGAATGAISSGVGSEVAQNAPAINSITGSPTITSGLVGAGVGALTGAVTGGNVGQSALTGGISGTVSGAVNSATSGSGIPSMVTNPITGAITQGIVGAATPASTNSTTGSTSTTGGTASGGSGTSNLNLCTAKDVIKYSNNSGADVLTPLQEGKITCSPLPTNTGISNLSPQMLQDAMGSNISGAVVDPTIMQDALQTAQSENIAPSTTFAVGGSAKCEDDSCGIYHPKSGCFKNPFCQAKMTPQFSNTGPEVLHGTGNQNSQYSGLTALKHIYPSIGSSMGLAAGGLPAKYHEAAPEGHHPEFITGVTGYYSCGGGTGQSDDIPAMLHDGDYVMDAETVSALGDGSSKAGMHVLEGFRKQVPHKDVAGGNPVPAKIADGEYVFPAAFVTALGKGDNRKGSEILDGLREKLREQKRKAPVDKIPSKAKSPLDYIKKSKG